MLRNELRFIFLLRLNYPRMFLFFSFFVGGPVRNLRTTLLNRSNNRTAPVRAQITSSRRSGLSGRIPPRSSWARTRVKGQFSTSVKKFQGQQVTWGEVRPGVTPVALRSLTWTASVESTVTASIGKRPPCDIEEKRIEVRAFGPMTLQRQKFFF